MSYRVIAVGQKHDPALANAIASYEKRLGRYGGVQWQLLAYSPLQGDAARRAESSSMREKVPDDDILVLLDERGTQLASPVFAGKLDAWRASGRRITFVIGGAYGVDDALRQRADYIWSLSPLVFPHQIVRLLLVEQLYRAHMVLENHPYHH